MHATFRRKLLLGINSIIIFQLGIIEQFGEFLIQLRQDEYLSTLSLIKILLEVPLQLCNSEALPLYKEIAMVIVP